MPPSRLSRALPLFRSNRTYFFHQFRFSSTNSTQSSGPSRLSRIESRLPRFLARYVRPLRNAPVSHVTAFLILHEITAIVPLFLFTAAFHWFEWLPPWFAEGYWVKEGVERFGRYFRKKGWIAEEGEAKGLAKWWPRGEGGVRLVVEVATAYALTKALLPFRLGLSVWLTPNFAKISTLPLKNYVRSVFARKSTPPLVKAAPSPAAGTNAVGAKPPSKNLPPSS